MKGSYKDCPSFNLMAQVVNHGNVLKVGRYLVKANIDIANIE